MNVEWFPNSRGTTLHAVVNHSAICHTGKVGGWEVCEFYRRFRPQLESRIPRCLKCQAAYEKRFGESKKP